MAFNHKHLNSIGGSLGKTNVWVYKDPDLTLSEIAANQTYFTPAKVYGMKINDIILVSTAGSESGLRRAIEGATPNDLRMGHLSIMIPPPE